MNEKDCVELLNALDTFRECRDSWKHTSNQCGFYDPKGYQEEHAKLDIKNAVQAVDDIVGKIVKEKVVADLRRDLGVSKVTSKEEEI